MSLIESFAGDYRRWSRIEQIVSPAFLIAALGGVASMSTPLLGGDPAWSSIRALTGELSLTFVMKPRECDSA
jgi:hypothetical protein